MALQQVSKDTLQTADQHYHDIKLLFPDEHFPNELKQHLQRHDVQHNIQDQHNHAIKLLFPDEH
eukprot:12745943-Prorocentrum_lima.AAC.1